MRTILPLVMVLFLLKKDEDYIASNNDVVTAEKELWLFFMFYDVAGPLCFPTPIFWGGV